MAYDFANILFAGPCNRFCPFCIGQQLPDRVNRNNLNEYPPRGIEKLIRVVNEERIRDVVFTGTVTDPQLYRHEGRLIRLLRERLHDEARLSLHTNGVLALRKLEVFNSYDRVAISFPSFRPDTYEQMMGSRIVPDLAGILKRATVPVKISCVVNEANVDEVDAFLDECRRIGVERVVVRKLFGETRDWPLFLEREPVRHFRSNPVFDWEGMEVTWWDFDASTCESVNLFADGTLGKSYLLTESTR